MCPKHGLGHRYKVSASNSHQKYGFWYTQISRKYFGVLCLWKIHFYQLLPLFPGSNELNPMEILCSNPYCHRIAWLQTLHLIRPCLCGMCKNEVLCQSKIEWTLYMLNLFEETNKKNVCMFWSFIETERMQIVEIFIMEDKDQSVLYSRYHGYWWPGEPRIFSTRLNFNFSCNPVMLSACISISRLVGLLLIVNHILKLPAFFCRMLLQLVTQF